MPFSVPLVSAVAVQLLCQLFKVVYYSVRGRTLRIGYLFAAGGMPSAHAAFAAALCVSLALSNGIKSDIFTVAFVFSVIIVYDILRVRSVVQRHSDLLARLAGEPEAALPGARPPGRARSLFAAPREIGHTPLEVAVGVVVGSVLGAAFWLLLTPAR